MAEEEQSAAANAADRAGSEEARALAGDLFGIRKSVRYHDRRAAFFERLHRLTDLCTILLAGVVIMELLGNESPLVVKVFAGIGALMAAVDLVVGFAKSADLHRHLKRRFILLEQKCGPAFSADTLRQERLAIEGDEPPVYRALDCLCVRELAVAEGHTRESYAIAFWPMPFYMRLTVQIWYWADAGARAAEWASRQPKSPEEA